MSSRNVEAETDQAQWQDSLALLCETYWYPLYAFLRRKGSSPDDAADLTQAFLARLIEKDFLKAVDPDRGRFRWFLMDAVQKFAAKRHASSQAEKRGGKVAQFALDFELGEERYSHEPADEMTPEKLFDRRWAITILESALEQLRDDYEQSGKLRLFEGVQCFLGGGGPLPSYAEVAEQLGISETAVKVTIHRLRERYRGHIRERVRATVDRPDELDDEIDELFEAL